jgi:hypothetical protein
VSTLIDRRDYAGQYGPTTGDRIHLADTGLVAKIEADRPTRRRPHRAGRQAVARPAALGPGALGPLPDKFRDFFRGSCRTLRERPARLVLWRRGTMTRVRRPTKETSRRLSSLAFEPI